MKKQLLSALFVLSLALPGEMTAQVDLSARDLYRCPAVAGHGECASGCRPADRQPGHRGAQSLGRHHPP